MSVDCIFWSPVETETLHPVRSTEETHRELLQIKPIPTVVQLPVTGRNRIFVQAGAFTVPENAQKMQHNLMQLGTTSISTIVINGTKFYRVRLGPVANVPQADALLSKVKRAGNYERPNCCRLIYWGYDEIWIRSYSYFFLSLASAHAQTHRFSRHRRKTGFSGRFCDRNRSFCKRRGYANADVVDEQDADDVYCFRRA